MKGLDYSLVVITHGEAEPLADTIASFTEHVHPQPSHKALIWDGYPWPDNMLEMPMSLQRLVNEFDQSWGSTELSGFCQTVNRAWNTAREFHTPWVFWLEHDFRFTRPVDMRALAQALTDDPSLLQMSLMRQPCNEAEIEAGSLVALQPDAWTPAHGYLIQRHYWTTNPSLIPADVIDRFAWPTFPQCEGRFTHQLLELLPEARFGVWGNGEPWVRHVGDRNGVGY